MANDLNEEDEAVGWNAIDQALEPIYGDQEPLHYGTVISFEMGGPDPSRGISAYPRQDPQPHRHFVTYGFTDLFEKSVDDDEESGYGFELTFRLKRDPAESQPPMWVLNLLQNLGRYVFSTGNVFSTGHHMNLNGPICEGSETEIRAIGFTDDPELDEIRSPFGVARFLQVAGLTLDEWEAIQIWNAKALMNALKELNPFAITDLDRFSYLENPSFQDRVAAGIAQDGSSCSLVYVPKLSFEMRDEDQADARLDALGARGLLRILPHRLDHGREFSIRAGESALIFQPGTRDSWRLEDETLIIVLSDAGLRELLDKLKPQAGEFALARLPGLTFHIERSEIKDRDGDIVETVG